VETSDAMTNDADTAKALVLALIIGTGLGCSQSKQNSPDVNRLPVQTHTYEQMQPLLANSCFRSKTAAEQQKWLRDIDAAPESDFQKTMNDLTAINASDRLLGRQGCQR
jgi:hypothetical protein